MITHELQNVWITSDGKKFLSEEEAKRHEGVVMNEEALKKNNHRLRYANTGKSSGSKKA